MATQEAPMRKVSRFVPAAAAPAPSEIQVLANPIAFQDLKLARAAEDEIRRAVQGEHLGTLQVRFRVCSDADEGLRFVCKVENPPRAPFEGLPAWRWWSPLLSSVAELGAALADGLRVREQRRAASARHPAA